MSNQEQIKRWERKGRIYGESVPEYLQKVWQNEGKGMNRSRMRKAWLQVMRSCGFPKASEKRGAPGQ